MKLFLLSLLAGLLFLAAPSAHAQTPAVEIASPDHAAPSSKAILKQHALYWNEEKHELLAVLHFGDELHEDNADHDETFEFAIPGVTFDPKTNLFTVADGAGATLAVARRRDLALFHDIKPTPNAFFRIRKDDGKIGLILDAYRPEVAAALKQVPEPGEKPVTLQSLFR